MIMQDSCLKSLWIGCYDGPWKTEHMIAYVPVRDIRVQVLALERVCSLKISFGKW